MNTNFRLSMNFSRTAQRRDLVHILKLLRAGVDINFQDANGVTALHWVVHEGNISMANTLIYCGANIDLYDNQGNGLLHQAIRPYNGKMVDYLLKTGVNTGHRNIHGYYILHVIAVAPAIEVESQLMNTNLNLNFNVLDQNCELPLHVAASAQREADVIDWLLDGMNI